jgi:hypothetical protein
MIKVLSGFVALSVLVALPAAAEPKKMSADRLDQVVAGTDYYYCPPTTDLTGNNGWGNGADPSNPGSDAGATAASKLANLNLTNANPINTNPTTSTGR